MTCQLPKFNYSDFKNEDSTHNPRSLKSRKKRHLFSNLYSSFVQKVQNLYRSLVWNAMKPLTFSEGPMQDSLFSDERLLKRHRRDSQSRKDKPISTFTVNNRTYDLYLKFTLDNYPRYEDLSKSLPNITLTMVDSKPVFKAGANKEQQNFDPSKHEPLNIAVGLLYVYYFSSLFCSFYVSKWIHFMGFCMETALQLLSSRNVY